MMDVPAEDALATYTVTAGQWSRQVQAYRQSEVLFFDRRREKISSKPVRT